MFPKSAGLPSILALSAMLCACQPPQGPQETPKPTSAESAFAGPPRVLAVVPQAGGLAVRGLAPAGAEVRLGSPAGAAQTTRADADGRWQIELPASAEPRIFGLSQTLDGRRVQAEGYVLVWGDGRAALLRAGAGAIRLGQVAGPAVTAVDFDQEGSTVVSGVAAPAAALVVRLDGRQVADGRADQAGRFSIALQQPLSRGAHDLEVSGEGFSRRVRATITAPPALASGPLRSQLSTGGLRVDWLTPGGGVQSTLLPN